MTHDNTKIIVREAMASMVRTSAEILNNIAEDIEKGEFDNTIENLITKAEKAERGELKNDRT